MLNFFFTLRTSDKPSLSGTDMNIVFDGNSLTYGTNASETQYYPKRVRDWLTSRVKSLVFTSLGVPGQTLTTMLANAPANIDTLIDVGKTNICVAWEDANDLLTGNVTGLQNFNNMISYVEGRKTAGFDYVIILTGYYIRLPYDLYQPTVIARNEQKDYFNRIYSESSPPWDVSIDLRDARDIGGPDEQNQDPTYNSDYIHLTDFGYDIVSENVINKGILKIFKF
jgi:lysophospholipase L1-like esterase